MKVLLTTFTATYTHTPLALYALRAFLTAPRNAVGYPVEIESFTINEPDGYAVEALYKHKPDVLGFSCYCWSVEKTLRVASSARKLLPDAFIVFGGPEMADGYEKYLRDGYADAVIVGEGEGPLAELVKRLERGQPLNDIPGLRVREREESGFIGATNVQSELNETYCQNQVATKQAAEHRVTIDKIPFPYPLTEDGGLDPSAFEGKTLYYEASRGCPFSCGYCLSHNDRPVRLRPIETVKAELQLFLNARVVRVKLCDRTFNAVKSFAVKIWRYLIENDNGVTCFHFEIAADLLDDETLALLKRARPELFQFEIGIQTLNADALNAINRPASVTRLFENIARLKAAGNIHLHLDLIAGLPREGYDSFMDSFNRVYALAPHQLQLGILKLLPGTPLRRDAARLGLTYADYPPYEILCTPDLPFRKLNEIKAVERVVELFYNSGKFTFTLPYMIKSCKTPWDFYERLARFWQMGGYGGRPHGKLLPYEVLRALGDWQETDASPLLDLLRFDLLINENEKNVPEWLSLAINEEQKRLTREIKRGGSSIRLEFFRTDILAYLRGETDAPPRNDTALIISYPKPGRQSPLRPLERADYFKGL
jgi:radical SAM superfamily enzyme YgiQ (UPF0313 family)